MSRALTMGEPRPARAHRASATRWRCSPELHLPRRGFALWEDATMLRRRFFHGATVMILVPLTRLAPVLAAGLALLLLGTRIFVAFHSRPRWHAWRARRRLEAALRRGESGVAHLAGTVSASERADGVVLGTGDEVWPTRFTVTFDGGEAQVEPSALCVASSTPVRLGDFIELLGPASRTVMRASGYRGGRRALLFEGEPERPIFVRKAS